MDSGGKSLRLALPGELQCRACNLRRSCRQVVAGAGIYPNKVMIIGEKPGAEEDRLGLPMVGPTGTLMRNWMKAINWDPKNLYITNVIKCAPRGGVVEPEHIKACSQWLWKEITEVDPDFIIAMGDVAYEFLLPGEKISETGRRNSLGNIRGNIYKREVMGRSRWIMPTWHPAYVSRNIDGAGPAFRADLLKAKNFVAGKQGAVIPFRTHEATWDEILECIKSPLVGFDLETDPLNDQQVIGIGVCDTPGNGLYYPLEDEKEAIAKIQSPEFVAWIEDPNRIKIVTQAKFEKHRMLEYGLTMVGYRDTVTEAWLLGDRPYGLKEGFHREFGMEMIKISIFKDMGFKAKNRDGDTVPDMRRAQKEARAKVVEYASQDPDATLRLHLAWLPLFEQRPLLKDLYFNVELPVTEYAIQMERVGMGFNPKAHALDVARVEVGRVIHDAHEHLIDCTGWDFNVNSPKQIRAILYGWEDELGMSDHAFKLPIPKLKMGEDPPTDKVKLAKDLDNPVVRSIFTERAARKALTTYVDKLPKSMHYDGRIRTDVKTNIVATGRAATGGGGRKPNLQNIPARTREDVDIGIAGGTLREAFVANLEWDPHLLNPKIRIPDELHGEDRWKSVIICPDLAQVEMRFAAHLSGDPKMIELLSDKNGDIHSYSAERIYKVNRKEMEARDKKRWKNMRYLAKTIGFGSLYGLTPEGLILRTPTLGLSLTDAAEFIDGFYAAYPYLRQWQLDTVAFARTHGYTETILGRRRYYPNIRANDLALRSADERAAMNAPIQGGAADYFKLCMIAVDGKLKELALDAMIIMQVHDEVIIEAPRVELDTICQDVAPVMETVYPLKLPVFADIEWGVNWGDLHEYDPRTPTRIPAPKQKAA